MNYKELQQAIENKTPIIWNDPLPIEGNDYTISCIDLPKWEDDFDENDLIILIQYNDGGSEAEVLIHELSLKYPSEGGYLDLRKVTSLPDGFNPTVSGDLDLSSLKVIPEGFNPTIEGELTEEGDNIGIDGITYKSHQNFQEGTGVCYSPENVECVYFYADFLQMAKDKFEELGLKGKPETMARAIFDGCQWKHPETVLEELEREGEFEEYPETYGIER